MEKEKEDTKLVSQYTEFIRGHYGLHTFINPENQTWIKEVYVFVRRETGIFEENGKVEQTYEIHFLQKKGKYPQTYIHWGLDYKNGSGIIERFQQLGTENEERKMVPIDTTYNNCAMQTPFTSDYIIPQYNSIHIRFTLFPQKQRNLISLSFLLFEEEGHKQKWFKSQEGKEPHDCIIDLEKGG